ncbi:histidine phosphatase family protein [Chitinophaga horti]|uniref:Histidine phosphatase family protein n=1 Tax=Chitinophaga horti TaxID=2920382 RepID=A0ABY6IZE7_9BACT|nr:histidine phosphatase family protein [Chitinophaga horti]UYQ91511.1 histidine phosphatase family protein [Chitinophaga horti]
MKAAKLVAMVGLLAACQPKQTPKTLIPVTEDSTFLTATVFLVRHAEKHPGVDSTLTAAGHQRAGDLYRRLHDSAIAKIYCTPYIRSGQTADSLRLLAHIDTVIYQADTTGESLIYEISRRNDWGKRILVIGHSNTLIPMMEALGVKPPVDSIGDRQFSYLFRIEKRRDGGTVKVSHYGLQ